MIPENRPSADKALTFSCNSNRLRINPASESMISARLPPVSRCTSTDVTKNRKSTRIQSICHVLERLWKRHAH